MKLLWSKHTNKYEKNGENLLFNSVSRATYRISSDAIKQIEDCFAGGDCSESIKRLIAELYFEKIIVDDKFDHQKYLLERFDENKRGPLIVYYIPTYNCNFRCPYCIVSLTDHNCNSEIISNENIPKIAAALVKYVEENDIKEIAFIFFGGEPTLALGQNLEMIDELNKLCDNKISITHSMVTNGYLLTNENIVMMKQAGIKSLQITLDGPKEIHDQTRVHISDVSTFDKLIENIEKCRKYRLNVVVRINFCQSNVTHIIELVELLAEKKLQDFIAIMLAPVDPNLEGEISGHDEECLQYVQKIYECMFKNKFFVKEWATYCGIGNNNFFAIDLHGNIYGCPSFAGMKEYCYGNLLEDRIQQEKVYKKELSSNCWDCSFVGQCAGGCAFTRLTQNLSEEYCFKEVHSKMIQAYYESKYLVQYS